MSEPRNYFAPCILVEPNFSDVTVSFENLRLHKRVQQVSTFDLATLASKHQLQLPYQLMDIFLSGPAHLEIEVQNCRSTDEATSRLEYFRTALYLNGVTPFVIPFLATHSFNDYAGINSRDSSLLREKLPDELRNGITSEDTTVSAWPIELSLMAIRLQDSKPITKEIAEKAVWQADQFRAIEHDHPELISARYALSSAPQISHLSSSLLLLWTGIESLFPNVSAELSFRIALLLAEFVSPVEAAKVTYDVAKRSYRHRSNAAHGNLKKIGYAEWSEAWGLLCNALSAVIHRRGIPNEADIISEILDRSARAN